MFLNNDSSTEFLCRNAIEDEFGNVKTYFDLEELSRTYAKIIPERSVIMIFGDYNINTVCFYYCMLVNHVVPILVDKSTDKEFILRLLELYEPQFIWGKTEKLNEFSIDQEIVLKCEEYSCSKLNYQLYTIDSELALLLTTSGSTGSPKMVRLSYENIRYTSQALIELIDLREDDKAITVTPLYHAYGLVILHTHWLRGASVLVTDKGLFDVEFWEVFRNHHVTNLSGVPFVFDILKQIGFLKQEYPDFRFMTQAGGKLSDDNQRLFSKALHENGKKLYIFLGLTEATGVVTLLPDHMSEEKIGSIGFSVPGTDCVIDGNGELVIYGPGVTLGYAQRKEDLNLEDSNKGKFDTGDIASLDEDGCIFLKGRKKRFIKILGYRISLDEVESLLAGKFKDVEIACQGEDNRLNIYVRGEFDEDGIKEYCAGVLKVPKNLISTIKIEKIPRNEAGKIMYQELNVLEEI